MTAPDFLFRVRGKGRNSSKDRCYGNMAGTDIWGWHGHVMRGAEIITRTDGQTLMSLTLAEDPELPGVGVQDEIETEGCTVELIEHA